MTNQTTTAAQPTVGDQIAREFSTDKVNLSDAEQRRLAGMIDRAMASKWTPCSTRMPPAGETVIVAFADQGGLSFPPSFAAWDGNVWGHPNWNRTAKREAVTHWMEMPVGPARHESPKEQP